MERRRVAVVLAGLVLVGGAVAVLRGVNGPPDAGTDPATPPLPTVLKAYAAQGVLAPSPGARPAAPGRLVFTAGEHRLQVTWGSAIRGGKDPAGAAGYDVRWGTPGDLDNDKLVVEPDAELDGLPDNRDTQVQVRTVDAFGQRSGPASGTGRARADTGRYTFADHFDGALVPDPRLWRLSSPNDCAAAGRGTGENDLRLVIGGACDAGAVALRSRTPFTLATPDTAGELGRFIVETDAPGEDGELNLDLVPGPVDLVGGAATTEPQPGPAGQAQDDPSLPPGTIRVRITGDGSGDGTGPAAADHVDVLVAPGTPRVAAAPDPPVVHPPPAPRTGLAERWEVVLRQDGLQVLCDGQVVGAANVLPQWHSATALVGISPGTTGALQAAISLIAFDGARASAPPLVTPPVVASADVGGPPLDTASGTPPGHPITGVSGGQLRMTLVPETGTATQPIALTPQLTVLVDGQHFPAQPAIPGTQLRSGVRYPIVVNLPAAVLVPNGPRGSIQVQVTASPQSSGAALHVQDTDLELTPAPGARPSKPVAPPAQPPVLGPHLAVPTATLANAAGQPVPLGQPLVRGRLVLTVNLDGLTTLRQDGQLAGLAGIETWLDGTNLATVPTAVDGPGIAGNWQIAFDPAAYSAGSHTIEVRGFTTALGGQYVETFATFTLGK